MKALAAACGFLLLVGCSADRIERGVFHSRKGYEVRLPAGGWLVAPGGKADLELRREGAPPAGMLADATCEGRPLRRPLGVLARHLFFGLADRSEETSHETVVRGRPAIRSLVRGRLDGALVAVEAVVVKDERCVYDFVYVAPAAHFEAGRGDFRSFVESFAVGAEP
ncbi:MAG: hypothetical protein HYV93_00305 [Candidatus Rokubacteria bacterium]|nr:hypothetical protein [Candidatus Rokubacteria bacterium]